jgi:hypothetical protein
MTHTTRLAFETDLLKKTPTVTVVRVKVAGIHRDTHVPHWVAEPHMWAVGDFMRSHRQIGGYLIHQTGPRTFDVLVEPQQGVA